MKADSGKTDAEVVEMINGAQGPVSITPQLAEQGDPRFIRRSPVDVSPVASRFAMKITFVGAATWLVH
jgi:hypothetical protein